MSAPPLFVTRKFPPSIGGMETLAESVWRTLDASSDGAQLIAHGGANRALFHWIPRTVARVLVRLLRHQAGYVLTGDALMYAVLAPMLAAFGVPNATFVMGLDLTYENRIYRAFVLPMVRRAPMVVAISEATAEEASRLGVPPERIRVVRLGVPVSDFPEGQRDLDRAEILDELQLGPDSVLLLTLGRLVRRKGVSWFVQHVLPQLPDDVHHLVAGTGPEAPQITSAAEAAGVADRVHLLGSVTDTTKDQLMRGVDLFIQPNVRVPGDMEGFGLVTVEAALRGTPVIASALEGILDAVVDGTTGRLVEPEDEAAWIDALDSLVTDRAGLAELGARCRTGAAELYSEAAMGRQLVQVLGFEQGAVDEIAP